MISDTTTSPAGRAGDNKPVTVREVLQLLLAADKYPQLGNEDWRVAAGLEREALAKAETAIPSPDDPPEFAGWLEVLCRRPLHGDEREAVYNALHDHFWAEEHGAEI